MNRSLEFNPSNSTTTAPFGFNEAPAPQKIPSQRRPFTKILLPGFLVAMLLSTIVFTVPSVASAAEIAIGVSLRVGPPPIPVYTQPPCPGPGYLWTPGYWDFDPDQGYYWVPGTWVMIPAPGLYWTPGYWGWGGDVFVWHAGYWGPHVGFYGGINYGFGYTGVGFVGGEWRGREFYYNRSVNNFGGAHIDHVYYRNVPHNFAENRVSYNGGRGGIDARPTREEMNAEHDHHEAAVASQRENQKAARNDRSQFAKTNHGMPAVAATRKPGELRGAGVVTPARSGGTYNPGENHGAAEHNPGFSSNHNPNPGAGGVHQPAGPAANPGGNHEKNSEKPSGFSRYHNPNAGGSHPPQPNVSKHPASPTPRAAEPTQARGSEQGKFHPSPPRAQNVPSNVAPQHNTHSSPERGSPPPSHSSTPHSAPHSAPEHAPARGDGGHENEHHH